MIEFATKWPKLIPHIRITSLGWAIAGSYRPKEDGTADCEQTLYYPTFDDARRAAAKWGGRSFKSDENACKSLWDTVDLLIDVRAESVSVETLRFVEARKAWLAEDARQRKAFLDRFTYKPPSGDGSGRTFVPGGKSMTEPFVEGP